MFFTQSFRKTRLPRCRRSHQRIALVQIDREELGLEVENYKKKNVWARIERGMATKWRRYIIIYIKKAPIEERERVKT
jgi:hypothetical protein